MYQVKVSYTAHDPITDETRTGMETLKIVFADNIEEAKEQAEEIVFNYEAQNYRITNFKVLSVKKV